MTERKASKRIIIFVSVFYVMVSILAASILTLSDSVFAERGEMDLLRYLRSMGVKSSTDMAEEVVEEMDATDKIQGLEALDLEDYDTEDEDYESDDAEGPWEEASAEEEEPVEEEVEEAPVEEEHYYSFRTNNKDTILRMREGPGDDAKIIYELRPGSMGYVIELGDEWSKVSAYGHEGYCSNEFLTMTEVTADEYEELKDKTFDKPEEAENAGQTAADAASTTDMNVNQAADAATTGAGMPSDAMGTTGDAPSEDP